MNKKEMEDETKLMDAIHSNAHENHCDYVIANNRAKIRKEKRENSNKKIGYTMFAILFILTLFLAAKYDEYSQKECVGNGYSEYFCRKNLG